MVTVPSVLNRYRVALDGAMRAEVGTEGALLYDIIRYHLGWQEADGSAGPGARGKALRPLLCLIAAAGIDPSLSPRARTDAHQRVNGGLAAAAAIELIHNFSLIHDDIQDQDRTRHNRPTAWTVWGVPQAINAGDGLWAVATRTLLRAVDAGVPAETVVRAQLMLTEACLTMIEGQSLDLAFEQQAVGPGQPPPVTVEQYLDMIARKTGALIATALAIGALIGSGDEAVSARFYRFGEKLGRAFQIQDDVLGVWGEGQLTGKSTSSDIRRRKQSFPIVYTLNHGPAGARAALAAVYALADVDDAAVARAVRALDEADARAHALALTAEAHDHALALLDTLPLTDAARADLRAIADFLLGRTY